MAAKPLFIFSLFLFSLLLVVSYSSQTPSLSQAHTELINYGFPIGLLPTNVHTYNLNRTSGHFVLRLHDTCRVTLPPDNYLATYSKTITGKIVKSRIAELDGISVRAFFKWWGITGIRSNGDDLTFEVGMVTANYPANKFDQSPECEVKRSSAQGCLHLIVSCATK